MIRPAVPLALAALLFAPLALFAPKGETPLLVLCAVLALLSPEGRRRARDGLAQPLSWALAALFAWALLSALWSLDPPSSFALWARLVALLVVAVAFASVAGGADDGTPALRALSLGAGLGIALAGLEMAAGNPIRSAMEGVRENLHLYQSYWLNRGMTAIALLIWPAAAALWPRGAWKAAALLAAGGAALLAGPQMAAKLALAVAAVVAVLAWFWGPRLRAALAAAGLLVCLAMPVAPGLLPDPEELQQRQVISSVSHRIQIWRFAVQRIVERPVLGWGLDAARDIPGGDAIAPGTIGATLMPLHPHNGPLQVWLELGAVGAGLLGLVVAAAFWQAASLPQRPARAAACAMVGAALVIGCVSYGIWQTQWLAVLGLSAAFMAVAARAGSSLSSGTPR